MWNTIIITTIPTVIGTLFTIWYQRYCTNRDQWRDGVNNKLNDAGRQVAVLETKSNSNDKQFEEIKLTLRDMQAGIKQDTQEIRSLLLSALGLRRDGN